MVQILRLYSASANKPSIIITGKNNKIWQYFKIYRAPCKAIKSMYHHYMSCIHHHWRWYEMIIMHLHIWKLGKHISFETDFKYFFLIIDWKKNLTVNYFIQKKSSFGLSNMQNLTYDLSSKLKFFQTYKGVLCIIFHWNHWADFKLKC